jgi:hypothetical protein
MDAPRSRFTQILLRRDKKTRARVNTYLRRRARAGRSTTFFRAWSSAAHSVIRFPRRRALTPTRCTDGCARAGVVGHGPIARWALSRAALCPGTTSLTRGRGRHPADRRRGRPALHARTHPGAVVVVPWGAARACRRQHVPGRRHGAITAMLSRPVDACSGPGRYGPHGRLQPRRPGPRPGPAERPMASGFFFCPTQVQRWFFGETLAEGSSITCARTRYMDVQDPSRSQASRGRWGRGREGDSMVAAGRYARLQTWGP